MTEYPRHKNGGQKLTKIYAKRRYEKRRRGEIPAIEYISLEEVVV